MEENQSAQAYQRASDLIKREQGRNNIPYTGNSPTGNFSADLINEMKKRSYERNAQK